MNVKSVQQLIAFLLKKASQSRQAYRQCFDGFRSAWNPSPVVGEPQAESAGEGPQNG